MEQVLITPHAFYFLPNRVKKIARNIAYRFVRQYHYLGYPPRCDEFCLGVFCDHALIGVVICGLPVARLEDQIHTLEVTHMCLLPSAKNSESRTLSLVEKWVKVNRPEIRRLIAYADTDRHTGTVYRAANWVETLRHKKKETWDRPNRHRKPDTGGPKIKFERIIRGGQ